MKKDLLHFHRLEINKVINLISSFDLRSTPSLDILDMVVSPDGSPSLYYDDKPHIAIDPFMMRSNKMILKLNYEISLLDVCWTRPHRYLTSS